MESGTWKTVISEEREREMESEWGTQRVKERWVLLIKKSGERNIRVRLVGREKLV